MMPMHFVDRTMFLVMRTVRNSVELFSTFTVKTSVHNPSRRGISILTAVDRELYKTRLDVFFKHYPSKAFDGRSWGELSEIILVSDKSDLGIPTQLTIA
jgi:hypothetical protein